MKSFTLILAALTISIASYGSDLKSEAKKEGINVATQSANNMQSFSAQINEAKIDTIIDLVNTQYNTNLSQVRGGNFITTLKGKNAKGQKLELRIYSEHKIEFVLIIRK